MPQPKDGSSRAANGAMRIDPGLVRELAELLTANALTEVEVEDGDRRIRVARTGGSACEATYERRLGAERRRGFPRGARATGIRERLEQSSEGTERGRRVIGLMDDRAREPIGDRRIATVRFDHRTERQLRRATRRDVGGERRIERSRGSRLRRR